MIQLSQSLLIAGLVVCMTSGAVAQKKPSQKEWRKMTMSARQANGELVELVREGGATRQEGLSSIAQNQSMRGGVVNPTSWIVTLSGAQAKYRFIRGEGIEIIARLPQGGDPQQLELFYFEVRGKLRVTYLQRNALPNPEHRRNTLPFRYSKQPDGQWKLRPLEQLPPGEYCFSPTEGEDSYCFGVDEKAVTKSQ